MEPRNYYNLSVPEVMAQLDSDPRGLSQEEAKSRLAQYGPNELIEEGKVSPWQILLGQFKNLLIVILLVAVVLSAVLGEVADAIAILIIVLFAAGLGFIQEYRAEQAMEALKKMSSPTASVLRRGQETEIAARDLVPGDIILLKTGDRVPADARIIEAINLKTDEAPLTGESVPAEKANEVLERDASIGDRRNMVFMGTAVVYGRGKAVVTSTGMNTEFGRIATMLQEVEAKQTPLQISLDHMGKWIAIGALVLSSILAILGILRGHDILEMVIWGVSLAVAAVPEALPAVVTISLAIGVQRMVKRHALIRKLPAVETLGCTTYICSDKTGTLTQDQMTVRQIYVNGRLIDVSGVGYEPKGEFSVDNVVIEAGKDAALEMLLRISSSCNDTSLDSVDGVWQIKGDPTEGALVVAAAKAGIWQDEVAKLYPRIDEIPFSSETKRMTTIHHTPEGKFAYSKGAPEVILESCSRLYHNGNEIELSYDERRSIVSLAQDMARNAMRVLAVAYKKMTDTLASADAQEGDMVLVGLVGMIDPPREEVKDAIKVCDEAGIKSVMITGDHKLTAVAIANELGLLKGGIAITGAELDNMSSEEFEALVEKIEVYARVSPAHKLRVVEALAKKGHVVAMTGDGVNDAPALKKADIGVAMGITGTDVSKEVAGMVLLDDNFASIVAAVEVGRCIFNNIKKFLTYLLACNIGLVLMMTVALVFGPFIGLPAGALPLVAIQILWVNLLINGPPAVALSADPPEEHIMRQKPRRGQGVFTQQVLILMAITGAWICLSSLAVFKLALASGRSLLEAQCLCFVTTTLIQLCNAYNFRSETKSLVRIDVFNNKWVNFSVVGGIALMVLVVYMPQLQPVFHTFALSPFEWIIAFMSAISIFLVLEVTKALIRWKEVKTQQKSSS